MRQILTLNLFSAVSGKLFSHYYYWHYENITTVFGHFNNKSPWVFFNVITKSKRSVSELENWTGEWNEISEYVKGHLLLWFSYLEYEQQLFVNVEKKHRCGRPNQRFNRSVSCFFPTFWHCCWVGVVTSPPEIDSQRGGGYSVFILLLFFFFVFFLPCFYFSQTET